MTGADLHWLVRLHGDQRVMRFIDDGQPVAAAVVATRTLPAMLRGYDRLTGGLGYFAAIERATGEPLGWFGLRPPESVGLLPAESRTAELGYRLLPGAWGKGYATEGARALTRSVLADLGLERVAAATMTMSTASRHVLDKAGLSLVRTFLAAWPRYIEGAEHGDVVYAACRGCGVLPPATACVSVTSRARAAARPRSRSGARPRG